MWQRSSALVGIACFLPDASALCRGSGCIVDGPASPDVQQSWLQELQKEKAATLQKINYTGGVFDVPELKWTQTSYMQPQMHPYDLFFFDPVKQVYTVDTYLDDLTARYGGIDSLLMWPTYTNIGADDRNQWDLIRVMPGGIEGVAKIIKQLKARGIHVLLPYNPWDTGTRREPKPDPQVWPEILKSLGGDGFNGDTMGNIGKEFWNASTAANYPIAFQPEGGGIDMTLNWDTMGWGYWDYPKIPVVDRFKFLTSGKWMTNVCDRWNLRKNDNLQMAYFNGDGYETWENVWGIWNGITPRDAEAIRRVATIERFFGKLGFLNSPMWEPHARGIVNGRDVFASKWPLKDSDFFNGSEATLWTIVNRGLKNYTGPQILITYVPGRHYYDCYHGVELTPAEDTHSLSFDIEVEGYGCVLDSPLERGSVLSAFLDKMRSLTQTKLMSMSAKWECLPQTIVAIAKTPPAEAAPSGMVFVPHQDNFLFESSGVEIEGADGPGVDFQYPWEDCPKRQHVKVLEVGPFYMDKFPVTTANYSGFLKATGYRPEDSYNWLKNWNGQAEPPADLLDVPVTYVGLEEARAYCKWANGGSRLPRSWEWQYAAQGGDRAMMYPWGVQKQQGKFPVMKNGTVFEGPEKVTAHAPAGDSRFGISDLVGNVWQYTDEFQDKHTRAVLLKGGSNYRPQGSDWYFPQALELNTHEKYFLMNDRYERAGTIGFRCVKDVASSAVGGENGEQVI